MTTLEPSQQERFSIAELATLGDVSRRTIRYYIQRELLPAPTGTGRGKHYTRTHLSRLLRIRTLADQGLSLSDIAERLDRTTPRPELTPQRLAAMRSVYTHIPLAEDVSLHIRLPTSSFPVERLERFQRLVHLCFELCLADDAPSDTEDTTP